MNNSVERWQNEQGEKRRGENSADHHCRKRSLNLAAEPDIERHRNIAESTGSPSEHFQVPPPSWRSQIAQVELLHTCTTFWGGLGAPNALLALLGAKVMSGHPLGAEGARPLTEVRGRWEG